MRYRQASSLLPVVQNTDPGIEISDAKQGMTESTYFACADGSQYCAWHPDSTRLAVSSDTLRAVFVMDAVKRTTLMWFEDLRRPCLALAFPTSPSLAQSPILVFAENARNIYIAGRQPPAM